jgi:hypothetical protein
MQNQSQIQQDEIRTALDSVTAQMASLAISINNLRALLIPEEIDTDAADVDPRHPDNKTPDQKLTPRGIEVCYRLFDRGENRNRVAALMDISFTAANYRHAAWLKLGGPGREKQPLV